jgi:PAS domain S-box-containing protein
MAKPGQSSIGWQDIARAVPGGIGVQHGETLEYVSPTFAELIGSTSETLTGRSWRRVFDATETDRLTAAVDTARTDGRWQGEIFLDDRDTVVDVTLSAPPDGGGAVLWMLDAHEPDQARTAESDRPEKIKREVLPPGASTGLARAVLDAVDDVVYIIAEDGRSWYWNDQLAKTTGYSHEEIAAMHPKEFIPKDQHEYVPGLRDVINEIVDRRVEVDILTRDGERITHEFSGTTFEDPETGDAYRCGVARNITERLEREQTLKHQRDTLSTLHRINDLLFGTARELIQTGSRNAVEEAVCDRLASSEFYEAAWIGEHELNGEQLVCRTAAGLEIDLGTLPSDDQPPDNVVLQAMNSGKVHTADRLDSVVTQWQNAMDERVDSLVSVPLQHNDTVYGVLVVTADRDTAFNAQEQAAFEMLGQLIGVVIHASRSRELLFADAVVELEFDFAGSDSPFVTVAVELDCRLTLDGYVPGQDGWVMYLSVDDGQPSAVADRLAEADRVDRVRKIVGEGETGRIEAVVTELSVLHVVTEAGATMRRASTTPERARFVVEVPLEGDLSQIVDDIIDTFPAADLVGTRKRDREITTVGRPGGILEELTDRQREVLEAAYQAGYFTWPRESTAEDVAEALGLTSATLHGHLRKAELVILSSLLDDQ